MQSNYVPWKGYFDLIDSVDEFLVYDSCQYTQYDWRNRNRIKTPEGVRWLTIPVQRKGHLAYRIDEMHVADPRWRRRHWNSLLHNYKRSTHFDLYRTAFEDFYNGPDDETRLSAINRRLIDIVCALLHIDTPIHDAPEPRNRSDKTETLIDICQRAGATRLLLGPRARNYLDVRRFRESGIELDWFNYAGYTPYPQRFGPFVHEVSIIDLLFNTGPDARHLFKSRNRPT